MNITEFLKDDDEDVRRTAKVLSELTEAYELKSLSKDEYDELVEDLLDMKKIDDLCDTIEKKAKLEKAFNALSEIISTVV
jgi:hypothetical protein